jgi:hypothetical protein
MAELLVSFTEPTRSSIGEIYWARALGQVADDGLWEGWLEFALAGSDAVFSTPRETEQPNRDDLVYWAQGLTATYLEGALVRALRPETPEPVAPAQRVTVRSAPRRTPSRGGAAIRTRVVLDPFLVYTEGEELLRKQLHALSRDHLLNMMEAYQFEGADDWHALRATGDDELVERIVAGVRSELKG